jgi:hypothetical protein
MCITQNEGWNQEERISPTKVRLASTFDHCSSVIQVLTETAGQ